MTEHTSGGRVGEVNGTLVFETSDPWRAWALIALTLTAIYLCWNLVVPFLNAFTWAFTLAVICAPFHGYLSSRLPRTAASLLIIVLVPIVVALPLTIVVRQLLDESIKLQTLVESAQGSPFRSNMLAYPWVGSIWSWINTQLDVREMADLLAHRMASWIAPVVAHSAGAISQAFVALLILFFLLRDKELFLTTAYRLLPLPLYETEHLIRRVSSAIRYAAYGRLLSGSIQGCLGGIIFALLGLPGPIFWGTMMSLLAVVPMLGPPVVWVPASVVLLVDGHWIRALILVGFGLAVIHPVDNLLFPVFVGSRVGLHPLVLFVAFVGGIIAFGPTGLVLGPCIMAFAAGLIDVWRQRSAEMTLSSTV